jgi:hypothetical protein
MTEEVKASYEKVLALSLLPETVEAELMAVSDTSATTSASLYLFNGNTKCHSRLDDSGDMSTIISGKLVATIDPVTFRPDDITQLITRDMHTKELVAENSGSTTQYLLQIAKLLSFPLEYEKTLKDGNFQNFIAGQLLDVEDLQSVFHGRYLFSRLIWAYESTMGTIPKYDVKFEPMHPPPPKPIGIRITHPPVASITDRLKRTYPFVASKLEHNTALMQDSGVPYESPFSTTNPIKRLKHAVELLENAEKDAEKRLKGTARYPFMF